MMTMTERYKIDAIIKKQIPLAKMYHAFQEFAPCEEFDAFASLIIKGAKYVKEMEERDAELYENIMAGNF